MQLQFELTNDWSQFGGWSFCLAGVVFAAYIKRMRAPDWKLLNINAQQNQ